MSCNVYVYDHTAKMSPLSSPTIEIIETDAWGRTIDRQLSTKQGPTEYGAKLKSLVPARPYKVWINDSRRKLAPVSLGRLNGKVAARLDVTLYPLPTKRVGTGGGGGGGAGARGTSPRQPSPPGGAGSSPATPGRIAALIDGQVGDGTWSAEEAEGVRSLVEAVVQALSSPDWDPKLGPILQQWQDTLADLGISIEQTTQGGGSVPAQAEVVGEERAQIREEDEGHTMFLTS